MQIQVSPNMIKRECAGVRIRCGKTEGRKIFMAKDFNREVVVRLDIAESILRREANGIWFEPVKIAGRSR